MSNYNQDSRELAEQASAHRLQGGEAAYMRSDINDRRRGLMAAWGRFCVGG